MYLCTRQFLSEFRHSPNPLDDYVAPVTGDRIRVAQLSDLHLRLDKRKQSEQLTEHVEDLSDLITAWKDKQHAPSSEFHGFIVSGDLIDASYIGDNFQKDAEECTRKHHIFSTRFICQAAQKLGIGKEDKDTKKRCLDVSEKQNF
uniref:Uncharacterized protein n=1 Tax=Candidatus Kentrum sp. TUN TaxID=2126343 RepID=A0A450ZWB1_9GAMM|nr:MAG: hypothetical protein BECKTUN1418F_GA0071002_11355 [Candidatus Kentron sp. TUN]VFK67108.1 MAG: hypothetical protein BECKTUN1418E_GA0071001_11325 [Candidatus Kentron sp. TUN]